MADLLHYTQEKNKMLLNRIAPHIDTDGKIMTYNRESVSIEHMDLFLFFESNALFYQSVNAIELNEYDIFSIIRVHALKEEDYVSNTFNQDHLNQKEQTNQEQLEQIKNNNPVMKNVTIFYRNNQGILEEYFNVVDSNGVDHVFYNDKQIDFMHIYQELERNYGGSFTLSLLIRELSKKLEDVPLESSIDILNRSFDGGVFRSQIEIEEKKYRDIFTKKVLANEKHGITIISDTLDFTNHQVITYDTEIKGNVVRNYHSGFLDKEENQEVIVKLIPYSDFKNLLKRETEYTEKERNSVELYFNFFEDLIYYEDYLLLELTSLLQDYRLFCENLELQVSEENTLTIHEQEACDRLKRAMENKGIHRPIDNKEENNNMQRFVPKLPDHYLDSTGSSGAILVILAVLLIVFLLAGITLSLIS